MPQSIVLPHAVVPNASRAYITLAYGFKQIGELEMYHSQISVKIFIDDPLVR